MNHTDYKIISELNEILIVLWLIGGFILEYIDKPKVAILFLIMAILRISNSVLERILKFIKGRLRKVHNENM